MSRTSMLCLVAASLALLQVGCQREPATVSFSKDVLPILEQNCKSCHVPGQSGYVVSGFELRDYDSLMKGTQYGPVVLPGDALTSTLVMLIEGRANPALNMPHGDAKPLSPTDINIIRTWVEQGAKNN